MLSGLTLFFAASWREVVARAVTTSSHSAVAPTLADFSVVTEIAGSSLVQVRAGRAAALRSNQDPALSFLSPRTATGAGRPGGPVAHTTRARRALLRLLSSTTVVALVDQLHQDEPQQQNLDNRRTRLVFQSLTRLLSDKEVIYLIESDWLDKEGYP